MFVVIQATAPDVRIINIARVGNHGVRLRQKTRIDSRNSESTSRIRTRNKIRPWFAGLQLFSR